MSDIAVYKLLNLELCQKNQELRMQLNKEQRINEEQLNELQREIEKSAAKQSYIYQLCKLISTFTGGFADVYNSMGNNGILSIDQVRAPTTTPRRASYMRRSVTANDEGAGINISLHSNKNSSVCSNSSSLSSNTNRSVRSHPDVNLTEIFEIPQQIQEVIQSDTIEEENSSCFDSYMEVDEIALEKSEIFQEIENSEETEESEQPIVEYQEQQLNDQLLFTIREEDSFMINNYSIENNENTPINIPDAVVIVRGSKLTKENLRRATVEIRKEVSENLYDGNYSFESHEDHIIDNETINKNHSILQKAASTPLTRSKLRDIVNSPIETPSMSAFSLTLNKIKVSPNTMAFYNSQLEKSDASSIASKSPNKKITKGSKKPKPERKSSGRPKRKAKPSIGSLIELSVNRKIRRSK